MWGMKNVLGCILAIALLAAGCTANPTGVPLPTAGTPEATATTCPAADHHRFAGGPAYPHIYPETYPGNVTHPAGGQRQPGAWNPDQLLVSGQRRRGR